MQDIDPAAARALALAALGLWGKGMALSAAQVIVRVRSRAVTRPEDARLMRVAPAVAEHPMVDTLGAAWRNEAEATPALLALAGAYVILGGAHPAFQGALLVYVVARWIHGLVQALGRQPDRTLAWLAGVVATATVAALLLGQIA